MARARNSKLHTSSLKRLMVESTDGGEYLKHEIAESFQRVKAVKYGMLINQLLKYQYNKRKSSVDEKTPKIVISNLEMELDKID